MVQWWRKNGLCILTLFLREQQQKLCFSGQNRGALGWPFRQMVKNWSLAVMSCPRGGVGTIYSPQNRSFPPRQPVEVKWHFSFFKLWDLWLYWTDIFLSLSLFLLASCPKNVISVVPFLCCPDQVLGLGKQIDLAAWYILTNFSGISTIMIS